MDRITAGARGDGDFYFDPPDAHGICARSDDDIFISLVVVAVTFLIASDSHPRDLNRRYFERRTSHEATTIHFKNTISRSE